MVKIYDLGVFLQIHIKKLNDNVHININDIFRPKIERGFQICASFDDLTFIFGVIPEYC